MGNHKSNPTGTIHVRTTSESIKKLANTANVTDTTMPVLEMDSTASDQDTTAVAADAHAIASEKTNAENTASISVTSNAPAPAPSPVEPEMKISAANTAQAPSTLMMGPVAAIADTKTKMEIATEIFKRMKKVKGATRKEIIDRFVAEAKLSKAGASTYYQLIKAKVEEN